MEGLRELRVAVVRRGAERPAGLAGARGVPGMRRAAVTTFREDAERFEEAKAALGRELAVLLSPLVYWLDRQFRSWPRFYAWLSR